MLQDNRISVGQQLVNQLHIISNALERHCKSELTVGEMFKRISMFLNLIEKPQHKDVIRHSAKFLYNGHRLKDQGLSEDEYRDSVFELYQEAIHEWVEEDPGAKITKTEMFWWTFALCKLGVGDITLVHLKDTIERNNFSEEEWMNGEAVIRKLNDVALLLDPPEIQLDKIPPGHSLWKTLGVNSIEGFRDLAPQIIFKLAEMSEDKRIDHVLRAHLYTLRNAVEYKGTNQDTNCISEEDEWIFEVNGASNVEYTPSIEECLQDLAEKLGIDLQEYTLKQQSRLLNIFDLFDQGMEWDSKSGLSFKSFCKPSEYETEKRAAQRLFKRIQRDTNVPQLKED